MGNISSPCQQGDPSRSVLGLTCWCFGLSPLRYRAQTGVTLKKQGWKTPGAFFLVHKSGIFQPRTPQIRQLRYGLCRIHWKLEGRQKIHFLGFSRSGDKRCRYDTHMLIGTAHLKPHHSTTYQLSVTRSLSYSHPI